MLERATAVARVDHHVDRAKQVHAHPGMDRGPAIWRHDGDQIGGADTRGTKQPGHQEGSCTALCKGLRALSFSGQERPVGCLRYARIKHPWQGPGLLLEISKRCHALSCFRKACVASRKKP